MKKIKRGLAVTLAAIMALGSIPVYADELPTGDVVTETEAIYDTVYETETMADAAETEISFESETIAEIETQAETEMQTETEVKVETETIAETEAVELFEESETEESESESETEDASEDELLEKFKSFNVDRYKADLLVDDSSNRAAIDNILNWQIPSEILLDDIDRNANFEKALIAWKAVTFDPGDYTTDLLTVTDYYETILLDVIQDQTKDPTFLDSIKNAYESEELALLAAVADTLNYKFLGNDGDVDELIALLKKTKCDTMGDKLKTQFVEKFLKTKSAMDSVGTIADLCVTAYDIVEKCALYNTLNVYFGTSMESTLQSMYENCSNLVMQVAIQNVRMVIIDEAAAKSIEIIQAGYTMSANVIGIFTSAFFDLLLSDLGLIKVAQELSTAIANIAFNTDEIYGQTFTLYAYEELINLMRYSVNDARNNYAAHRTDEGAAYLLDTLFLYTRAAAKGCDYACDYADAVQQSGLSKFSLKTQKSCTDFKNKSESIKTIYESEADFLLNQMWKSYFSGDYPDIFAVVSLSSEFGDWSYVATLPEGIDTNIKEITWSKSFGPFNLGAKVIPSYASNKNLTYTSAYPSSVKVSSDGWVTPLVEYGSSTITIATANGIKTTIKVTISPDYMKVVLGDYVYYGLSRDTVSVGAKNTQLTDVVIPETIQVGGQEFEVTEIHEDGFKSMSSITSITLPKTVTTIGKGAFRYCRLPRIEIPETITSIGESAFYGCWAKEVIIPEKTLNVGKYAFQASRSLESVTIKGKTALGSGAFEDCTSLTNVDLGETISLDQNTLSNTAITSITLPATLLTLDSFSFLDCVNLIEIKVDSKNPNFCDVDGVLYSKDKTKIIRYPQAKLGASCTIDAKVKRIEAHCFDGNQNLEELIIPDNLVEIGNASMRKMEKIKSLSFPDSVEKIGTSVCSQCPELISVKLPAVMDKIPEHMFSYCSLLADVTWPLSLRSIDIYAFYMCPVKDIVLPEGLKSILSRAFYFNGAVSSLIIPSTVNFIGDRAFLMCTKLNSITFLGDPPTTVYQESFPLSVINENDRNVYVYTPLGNENWTDEAKAKFNKALVFRISPVSLSKATLKPSSTEVTYTGKALKPSVKVTVDGKTIPEGCYTVSYSHNLNVGTMTITVKGTDGFTGSLATKITIKPRSLASSVVVPELSKTAYTYDGTAKKPAVTVKHGTKTLVKDTDYTVTYASGRKTVGPYTVTLKGKGNYTGTKTLTFKIIPKTTTISSVTAGTGKMTVKWSKQATQTTGYQIQYSTSSSFASGNKTVTVSSNTITGKTISNLTKGKKYYVRIRTYKTVGSTKYYSSWSAKKYATIK